MPRDIIGACPLDCPDSCSWVITVDDDGHAIKLRGNPAHPHTRGSLCVKVNPFLEFSRDQSRLLYPLKRVGAKGQGRFERIPWDEALTLLASRLQAILETTGGDAIWPYDGTGTVGYLQGVGARHRFWNAIGAARHLGSICSISGHVGIGYTSGTAAGMDPQDMVDSHTILLWGSNTLTSNQHLWPFVEQARAGGAHVVVIDPLRHRTAERADEHVALRAGTDAALALALCHVIRETGVNEAFLRDRTQGWTSSPHRWTATLPNARRRSAMSRWSRSSHSVGGSQPMGRPQSNSAWACNGIGTPVRHRESSPASLR